jgi:hypothetical protein
MQRAGTIKGLSIPLTNHQSVLAVAMLLLREEATSDDLNSPVMLMVAHVQAVLSGTCKVIMSQSKKKANNRRFPFQFADKLQSESPWKFCLNI